MLVFLVILAVGVVIAAVGIALVARYAIRVEAAEAADEKAMIAWKRVQSEEVYAAERGNRDAVTIQKPDPAWRPKKARLIVWVGVIVLGFLVVFISFGVKQVGPGQVGVVTQFGEVQEGTRPPGLHLLIPMVQGMTIFDSRVQAYNFEGISGATKDLQPVSLSGLINFHIDPDRADRILQNIGGPSEYAEKVFLRPANTALKEQTPNYSAFNVISKRDEIGQQTLEALTTRMAPLGIIIDRVSVENISLNELFLASVEAKQIAEQDLERAAFEADKAIRLAEGERDAQVTRATGDKDSRILRADGEAQANDLINASLTEDLLTWAAIQKFNDKVKVLMVPSDQGLIFDVGDVVTDPQEE